MNFTSVLNLEYSEALEKLMFFNPGQQNARAAILESVEKYGSPSVHEEDGRLRVKVEKIDDVQTLFALDGNTLAGVLIYSRIRLESLTVIHLAVDQDYSSNGKFAHKMLMMRMLNSVRDSAKRIKSVKTIQLMYCGNNTRNYPC